MTYIQKSRFFVLPSLASALALALVGCSGGGTVSSDNAGGGGASVDATADIGVDAGATQDAGSEPEEISAALEVTFEPSLSTYSPGLTLEGSARVFDADGETIEDPDVAWSAEPSEVAESKGGGTIELKSEGTAIVEACATIPSGQEICGSKDLAVDGGPPKVEISSPQPGDMLGSGSVSRIEVTGTVEDSSDDVRVYVNGKRARPDSSGEFSVNLDPKFGINPIRVSATDGLHQKETQARFDVLWADNWAEMSSDGDGLGVEFDTGVGLDLGQKFFDDGRPPVENSSESKLVATDLADIFELLISNLNLSETIPDPVFESGDTRLSIRSVQIGDPTVIVDVTDTGLHLFVHIPSLFLQTEGQAEFEDKTLELDGSITSQISAFAEMSVDKSAGEFEASVDEVEVSVDEVVPAFSDQANAIFDLAEGALQSTLEERLGGAIRDRVVDTIPDILTETLNSLQDSLANQTFEFQAPVTGDQRTVTFDGSIETFDTEYRRSMRALLATKFTTSATDIHPSAPGVPMPQAPSAELPFLDQGRIQVAMRMAILNGVATALWKTEFLEGDVTDQIPDSFGASIESASVSGKLPPVIRPSREEESTDFVLEVGQFVASLEALGQTDTYGVHIETGIDIELDGNKLGMTASKSPEIDVWLVETSGGSPVISPEDVRNLLSEELWPTLRQSIQDGLTFELPLPDTSRLSDVAPALENMNLGVELAKPVRVREGVSLFDAQLRGSLPLN